jgi:hypothetical protein
LFDGTLAASSTAFCCLKDSGVSWNGDGKLGTAAAGSPWDPDSFSFDEPTYRRLEGFSLGIIAIGRIVVVDLDVIRMRDAIA